MKKYAKKQKESNPLTDKVLQKEKNEIKPIQSSQVCQFDYFTPEKLTPSTDYCRIKHSFTGQKSPDPYYLNSRLLELCDLPGYVRERMIVWLMEQASSRYLQRQTCSLSITYLDLFLMNKGIVAKANIQQLAIACLNIACKLNESCMASIEVNAENFSQQSIANFEIQIAARMKFRLHPPNYAFLAQQLFREWDQYIQNFERFRHITFFPIKEVTVNLNSRRMFGKVLRFYQLLDCSLAMKQMLDYDVEDLVYNAFYVFLLSDSQLINPQEKENFESFIQNALNQISQRKFIANESSNQMKKVLLDDALQKLLLTVFEQIEKFELREPKENSDKFLNNMHKILPIFNLVQLSHFQCWKPFYSKVVKQSSSRISHLQQSFQI